VLKPSRRDEEIQILRFFEALPSLRNPSVGIDYNPVSFFTVGRPKKVLSAPRPAATDTLTKGAASSLSWSTPRKRPPVDFFLFNGTSRKTQRKVRERDPGLFHRPTSHLLAPPMPIKGIFGSPFESDSFSSIANSYSTFRSGGGGSGAGRPVAQGLRDPPSSSAATVAGGKKPASDRDRRQLPVKLDHEGVTSPKTKNGKALLRDKSLSSAGAPPPPYIHPALMMKDGKKGGGERDGAGTRFEPVVKGAPPLRKRLPAGLGVQGGDYSRDYPSDGPSSYSELDEDEEDDARDAEAPRGGAADPPHRGGRFLSRLSACFSSSSSSSSASVSSSSSPCSSDNDSSYSSDEESSSVLLRRALLQQDKHRQSATSDLPSAEPAAGASPPPAGDGSAAKKLLKRKERSSGGRHEGQSSAASQQHKAAAKDPASAKRQRMTSPEPLPNNMAPPPLPGHQLWKWSGNPTQVRAPSRTQDAPRTVILVFSTRYNLGYMVFKTPR